MTNQKTGKAYISVSGKLLPSRDGAKLTNYAAVERKPVIGSSGVHGYVETHIAPEIECTLTHGPELSLEEIARIKDATITFECDSGPMYVLRHAWNDGAINLTVGEAEVEVKFIGISCEEQLT